ncbi:MAG: hypothetical protein MZV49_12605 [Rhodopseudomonas palustris]|nr:hypothetical protein [Rhodopseudomonas palustris]
MRHPLAAAARRASRARSRPRPAATGRGHRRPAPDHAAPGRTISGTVPLEDLGARRPGEVGLPGRHAVERGLPGQGRPPDPQGQRVRGAAPLRRRQRRRLRPARHGRPRRQGRRATPERGRRRSTTMLKPTSATRTAAPKKARRRCRWSASNGSRRTDSGG